MLFGSGQYPNESDDEQIVQKVSADVLRATAHVFLFEAAHAIRDGIFNFAVSCHETEYDIRWLEN